MRRWKQGKDLQGADAKHHDDVNLLLGAHGQIQELWDRDTQDDGVEEDVDGSVGPCKCVEVDTFALVLAVPVCPDVRDRYAVEDGHEGEDNTKDDAHYQQNVSGASELFARKYAQAKQEKRHFCRGDGGKVEDFSDPGQLRWLVSD